MATRLSFMTRGFPSSDHSEFGFTYELRIPHLCIFKSYRQGINKNSRKEYRSFSFILPRYNMWFPQTLIFQIQSSNLLEIKLQKKYAEIEILAGVKA